MKNNIKLFVLSTTLFAFSAFIHGYSGKPYQKKSFDVDIIKNEREVTARPLTYSDYMSYITKDDADLDFRRTIGPNYYVRYELNSTLKSDPAQYLNIEIEHNANITDTVVSISSISLVDYSFTVGIGAETEAKAPFAYSSFSTELSSSFSSTATKTVSYDFSLRDDDPSGSYYLYYEGQSVDAIIAKFDNKTGTFISAEYYEGTPKDSFNLILSQQKPKILAPTRPNC